MILFLRDHNFGEQDIGDNPPWRSRLERVSPLLHKEAIASDELSENSSPAELLSPDAVIFLHPSNSDCRQKWIDWFAMPDTPSKGHLVIVSREGGVTQDPKWTDRVHACYWGLEHFSPRSDNESVREFIIEFKRGVFRPELLQPRSMPEPILAYALAVHYGLIPDDFPALRHAADKAYAEMFEFARTVAKRSEEWSRNGEVDLLPEFEQFEGESATGDEANSIRFRAMRNLIDVLRADR
jgi:hypothetical protein